jgi:hypothetical protein
MRYVPTTFCSKCSTPIYFPALSRFVIRPQLLTRCSPLPVGRDIHEPTLPFLSLR